MSEESIESLRKQLLQKDDMIAVMKTKTKEFVAKIKEEHAENIAALNLQVQQREAVLLQEAENGRRAMQGLADVKPLIADLKARVNSLTEEKAALEAEHASAIQRERREAQITHDRLEATVNTLKEELQRKALQLRESGEVLQAKESAILARDTLEKKLQEELGRSLGECELLRKRITALEESHAREREGVLQEAPLMRTNETAASDATDVPSSPPSGDPTLARGRNSAAQVLFAPVTDLWSETPNAVSNASPSALLKTGSDLEVQLGDLRKENAALKKEVKEGQRGLAHLQALLDTAQREAKEVGEDREALRRDLRAARDELHKRAPEPSPDLAGHLSAQSATIASLQTQLVAAHTQLAETQQEMDRKGLLLTSECDRLRSELEHVNSTLAVVEQERDKNGLLSQSLSSDCDQLRSQLGDVNNTLAAFRQEMDKKGLSLTSECDTLRSQLQNVNNTLVLAEQERDKNGLELEKLRSKWDDVNNTLVLAEQERDRNGLLSQSLQSQLGDVNNTVESQRREIETLELRNLEISEKLSSLQNTINTIQPSENTINHSIVSENTMKEGETLSNTMKEGETLSNTMKETDLNSSLDEMEGEINALTAQYNAKCSECSSLNNVINDITLERDQIKSQVLSFTQELKELKIVLENTINTMKGERDTQLDTQKQEFEIVSNDLNMQIDRLKRQLNESESKHQNTQQMLLTCHKDLEQSMQKYNEIVRNEEKSSQEAMLKISNLSNMVTGHEDTVKALNNALNEAKEALASERSKYAEAISYQKALSAQLVEKSAFIDTVKEKLQSTVQGYRREINDLSSQLQQREHALAEKNVFAESLKDKWRASAAEHEQAMLALRTELDTVTIRLRDAENKSSDVGALAARCEHLEAAAKHAEALELQLAVKEAALDALNKEKASLVGDLAQLKSEHSSANTALISLESEKLQASAECSQLQEALVGAEKELSDLRAELASVIMDRNALRLTSEDLLVSLRSKDEAVSNMQQSFEFREGQLKQQLTQLTSQHKISSNEMLAEVDLLRGRLSSANSEKSDLQSQIAALQDMNRQTNAALESSKSALELEKQQNQERKKKVRAYLDTLISDNKTLTATVTQLETDLSHSRTATQAIQHNRALLEEALHRNKEKAAEDLRQKSEELRILEERYAGQLKDKDLEITHLLLEVDNAFKANREEVSETLVRFEESKKEMEAHKAKRLAARNEMINLAKSLERAQLDGEEIKNKVQYCLTPMVFEQISSLQSLLCSVEVLSGMLVTSSGPGSKVEGAGRGPGGRKDTSSHSLLSRDGEESSFSAVSNAMVTPRGSVGKSGPTGGFLNQCSSVCDALVQVEGLSKEVDRVQSGLVLVSQSIQQLTDTVRAQQQSSMLACCSSSLLSLLTSTSTSTHPSLPNPTQKNNNTTHNAVNNTGYVNHPLPNSSARKGLRTADIRPPSEVISTMFLPNSNKSKGYENLGGSKGGHLFSIEGHDEDDD